MKQQILDKASDLFLSLGFKSVTMDDIAREMGISKKTIYAHYPTKNKLVHDATFHVFERINNGICQICSGDQNPIQEIFSIKSLILEQLKGEKTSPQYQLEKYYPKIFRTLKEKQFESVNSCVSENLKRGMEEGYYRKDLDIGLIMRFYFNGYVGLMNQKVFPVKQYDISSLKDSYLEYHIRAIATEKGLKTLRNILNR